MACRANSDTHVCSLGWALAWKGWCWSGLDNKGSVGSHPGTAASCRGGLIDAFVCPHLLAVSTLPLGCLSFAWSLPTPSTQTSLCHFLVVILPFSKLSVSACSPPVIMFWICILYTGCSHVKLLFMLYEFHSGMCRCEGLGSSAGKSSIVDLLQCHLNNAAAVMLSALISVHHLLYYQLYRHASQWGGIHQFAYTYSV